MKRICEGCNQPTNPQRGRVLRHSDTGLAGHYHAQCFAEALKAREVTIAAQRQPELPGEPQMKNKKKREHLSWIEVNSILGQIASELYGVMRYLPPNHPQDFCQSITVAGIALVKLANRAADYVSQPPTAGHVHE